MSDYKIKNLLLKYNEYFNREYRIETTNNFKIDFTLDFGTFCHLMGLHYALPGKSPASIVGTNIMKKNLKDSQIFNNIKTNNANNLKSVKSRINKIDDFFNNLENSFIVSKTKKTGLKSIYLVVQIENNNFLELGIANNLSTGYFLETFIIESSDKYFKNSNINYNIKSIYELKNNIPIPFSFNKLKENILINNYKQNLKNFNYLNTLNQYNYNLKNNIENLFKKYINQNQILVIDDNIESNIFNLICSNLKIQCTNDFRFNIVREKLESLVKDFNEKILKEQTIENLSVFKEEIDVD
ncbi:hypothetical protein [Oceanivirga miroungae]|uniref:Phage-Barnase-EndoU-ColicinE5/D-RelE like nuclease 4 domain-containing protein n=1 Tax=Oceanivirga miroungae TaxID=1130046 RepID=A0A6I8M4Y0_9FUSO|nr:hypothetical protein [Oceanivirga miroungae]VWL84976.1 hypothetical protein OMES3154_00248 [Oceanivirga miroungae]